MNIPPMPLKAACLRYLSRVKPLTFERLRLMACLGGEI